MTKIIIDLDDPKLHQAAEDIAARIRRDYPDAQISIEENLDPPKLYVVATVDLYDTDPVFDSYVDRLIDYQIEDRLPLDVIVYRTPEREQEVLERERDRAGIRKMEQRAAGA